MRIKHPSREQKCGKEETKTKKKKVLKDRQKNQVYGEKKYRIKFLVFIRTEKINHKAKRGEFSEPSLCCMFLMVGKWNFPKAQIKVKNGNFSESPDFEN